MTDMKLRWSLGGSVPSSKAHKCPMFLITYFILLFNAVILNTLQHTGCIQVSFSLGAEAGRLLHT